MVSTLSSILDGLGVLLDIGDVFVCSACAESRKLTANGLKLVVSKNGSDQKSAMMIGLHH